MTIKKVFRKFVAVNIIVSLFITTFLSYPPIILKAEAGIIHNNSNIFSFIKDIRQYGVQGQKEQQVQYDANSINLVQDTDSQPTNPDDNDNDNNNQTNLSQEEIDKIVNEHTLALEKVDQAPKQVVETLDDGLLKEDQKNDRFIIKYRSEDQKEETAQKIKGNIKNIIPTNNKKFDVVVTTEKMKKEDFEKILKQKQADTNIEYIQPDYVVTTASAELPQENLPPAPILTSNNAESTSAPLLSTITFDGLKIALTYEKTLNSSSLPSNNDYEIKDKAGQAVPIAGIEIKENNVITTLVTPIDTGESIAIGYVP